MGAILGSNAQNAATRANLQMAKDNNDANYRIFRESRGAGGNAILPLYMGDFENQLGNNARDYYQQTNSLLGSPGDQYTRYRNRTLSMYPAVQGGDQAINDIYNGQMTKDRLSSLAPVQAARTSLASGQRQGIMEGLQQQLNQIKALDAAKGFSGGGSYLTNRLLASQVQANQSAANVMGQANLQNVTDARDIQDQGRMLQLQFLNAPYQRAQQDIAFDNLPFETIAQNQQRAMAPLSFFKLNPGNFQYAPPPTVGASPSAAQIALSGVGAANSQLGSYFLNRNATQAAIGDASAKGYFNSGTQNYFDSGGASGAGNLGASTYGDSALA